jgi:hypothetical protein
MDENPYMSPKSEPEREMKSEVEADAESSSERPNRDWNDAIISGIILLIFGGIFILMVSVAVFHA